MTGVQKAICPQCEGHEGVVGEICPEPVCRRKPYHLIPENWYLAAREYARKKNRPLDPLLGRMLDKFLLSGLLGEGGMGAVYLALQMPLCREVALKLIAGLELTESSVARFEREARAVAALDHPNIVKLYDYGVANLEFRIPYMALEYVRHGRTLKSALKRIKEESGGQVPGAVVLSIFRQILHALSAAHKVGLVHRDMKPDNVMIAAVEGNPHMVKVLDFGLAKAVAEVSGFDGDVSRTGQILGTPYYMAPEQAPGKGRAQVDSRADLYSVAVMLFEMFTGVRPFEGQTPLELLAKKVDPGFRPLDMDEAGCLPTPLRNVLAKGMAINPDNRYSTADEMLADLERAITKRTPTVVGPLIPDAGSSQDKPVTPPSPTSNEAPTRFLERQGPTEMGERDGAPSIDSDMFPPEPRRTRIPVIVATLLILVAAGVGAYVGLTRSPDAPAPREKVPVAVPEDIAPAPANVKDSGPVAQDVAPAIKPTDQGQPSAPDKGVSGPENDLGVRVKVKAKTGKKHKPVKHKTVKRRRPRPKPQPYWLEKTEKAQPSKAAIVKPPTRPRLQKPPEKRPEKKSAIPML
ncbi:MAG: protein kinase [Deltaproteobacteria bacterium]|nr:protein kinase [Deltaproteobacteria bacterium]